MKKFPHRKTMRRTFLTGLVVILPILVTVWIVMLVFGQIDQLLTPVVLRTIHLLGLGAWTEKAWVDWVAPLASVALSLLGIYIFGLVGGNVIGRQMLRIFDRLLMQVPIIRGIYSAVQQFLETFSRAQNDAFNRVVLVEYPRPGLWTMAFVTNRTEGEIKEKTGRQLISVFVPTTPNPTSGWLLFVPEEDAMVLDLSVDEAFKMIISGGVLTPPFDEAGVSPQPSAES